jgi:hypothetical protein
MKMTLFSARKAALVGALGFFGMATATVALEKATVGKPEFDDLPSPEFAGTKNKSFRPKDWLEMEVSISIPAQNRAQQEAGFLDRVMVKWYVAMKEKTSGKPVLLTKDVNHVNVPVDEEFFSSVYLSPNTMKRMTGKVKGGKSDVEVVAVEVFVDGEKVGVETSKMKLDWWKSASLSRGDAYPLLNKNETPFKAFWWDRYAEIEPERR